VGRPLSDAEVRMHRAVSVADTSRSRPPRTIGLLAGQNTLTVSTMGDKLAAQLQGYGAGFLPRHLVQSEMQRGALVRLLIRQLNMANKNLGGVFDSRILEVRLDTFGFALEFA